MALTGGRCSTCAGAGRTGWARRRWSAGNERARTRARAGGREARWEGRGEQPRRRAGREGRREGDGARAVRAGRIDQLRPRALDSTRLLSEVLALAAVLVAPRAREGLACGVGRGRAGGRRSADVRREASRRGCERDSASASACANANARALADDRVVGLLDAERLEVPAAQVPAQQRLRSRKEKGVSGGSASGSGGGGGRGEAAARCRRRRRATERARA